MDIVPEGEVGINIESDIVIVRKMVRDIANKLMFGLTDVTRIVTASSELARNVYLYAGSGVMRWRVLCINGTTGLELSFVDKGPGISNPDLVMQEGYTTSKGLGMGLPGSKRLMDEMEIKTKIGEGTTIIIRKWLRRR